MGKLILILLVIAVGGLLLVGGGAWYWWDRHSAEWLEAGKAIIEDGEKSGGSLAEGGCVVQALERHKSDWNRSVASTVRNGLWLTGCLDTSAPQQRFCEGVPPEDSPIAIGAWAATICAQHGLSDPYCHTLFQNVSKYCSSPRRAEKIKAVTRPGFAT